MTTINMNNPVMPVIGKTYKVLDANSSNYLKIKAIESAEYLSCHKCALTKHDCHAVACMRQERNDNRSLIFTEA